MTISITQVANTQSFGTWLQRTNDIIVLMAANVVTADSTLGGSITTGNAFVNGIFGSNTLYVTNISAGNISTNGAVVNITSNLNVTGVQAVFGNSSANVILGYLSTPSSIVEGFGNQNNYIQASVLNTNVSGSSSADFIAYNDVSANVLSNVFIDMGINGTNWSNTLWTISGPNDGYVYSGNNNISVGTAGVGYINFFSNGTLATNEVMRLTSGANVGIGNTNPNARLQVTGTANVSGNVIIGGAATFANTIAVTGNATFSNQITVTGNVVLANTIAVTGNATFSNQITAVSNVLFSNTIVVTGNATFSNQITVTGNVVLSNTIAVTGNATFSNAISVTGTSTLGATIAANISIGTINTTSNGVTVNSSVIAVGNSSNQSTISSGYISALSVSATTFNIVNATSISINTVSASSNGLTANSSALYIGNTTVNTQINAASIYLYGASNTSIVGGSITTNSVITYNLNVTGSISGTFLAGGNIIPTTNNTLLIGSASNTFYQIYSTNVFSNSVYTNTINANTSATIYGALYINANTTANVAQYVSNTYSFANNIVQIVDSFTTTTYRSAEYTAQIVDNTPTSGGYQITKLLVVQDGINAYVTEYGTIFSNTTTGSLATFSANISGTTVRLYGIVANSTIANSSASNVVTKFVRTTITV